MSAAISGATRTPAPDVASLIRATTLHLRRDQILHFHAVALLDDLRDPLPVALRMITLITENAYRPRLVHQRRQLVELLLRRSEEHTSELQSLTNLVCRLLL